MTEETKPEEETVAPPEEEKPKGPGWEYKSEFAINGRMREVVGLTISAVESEVHLLRRKLEKLQYGS